MVWDSESEPSIVPKASLFVLGLEKNSHKIRDKKRDKNCS